MNYSFDYDFPANMPYETKSAVRNQLFDMNLEKDSEVKFVCTNSNSDNPPCFDVYVDDDYIFSIDSDNNTVYER